MTTTENSNWALLIDGSALFFGQRSVSPERNMDYRVLADILQTAGKPQTPPRPALFFTAVDDSNEKQSKFNQYIGDLGWNVRQIAPQEAFIINALLTNPAPSVTRFDSMIAYVLGRLCSASPPSVSGVVIVSDSWTLAGPIRDCVSRGMPVTFAFFGGVVDQRWHRVFRDAERNGQSLKFLDLDMHASNLFSRPRSQQRRDDLIPDVP